MLGMTQNSSKSRRPQSQKSTEFCVVHPDGHVSDAELHDEILDAMAPDTEARVREIGKEQARRAGLAEEEIRRLYDDPKATIS